MTILVGTSGYSYRDWVGSVYPPELPKWEWLPYYAREFSTCELNTTFYRLPEPALMKGIARRVPEGFLFSVKAFQGITHEREDPGPQIECFVKGLTPLIDAGKFACVLVQFPYSFHASEENRAYLARLREGFGELPVVVEFRSGDWIEERTFEELRALRLGFCCVDQPRLPNLIPPVAVATAPIAYVRFHGRNAEKWWQHERAWERYNYAYTDEELAEWVPKLRQLDAEASLTLVYMNNHWQGQAVGTARQLRRLLGEFSI